MHTIRTARQLVCSMMQQQGQVIKPRGHRKGAHPREHRLSAGGGPIRAAFGLTIVGANHFRAGRLLLIEGSDMSPFAPCGADTGAGQ
jgi:hypothetical protein